MSKFDEARDALQEAFKNTPNYVHDNEVQGGRAELIYSVSSGCGENTKGEMSIAIKINDHLFCAGVEQCAEFLIMLADTVSTVGKVAKK